MMQLQRQRVCDLDDVHSYVLAGLLQTRAHTRLSEEPETA